MEDGFIEVKPRHQRKLRPNKVAFNKTNIVKLLKNKPDEAAQILNDVLVLPYFIKGQCGHITGWALDEFLQRAMNRLTEKAIEHNPTLTKQEAEAQVKTKLRQRADKRSPGDRRRGNNYRIDLNKCIIAEYIKEVYHSDIATGITACSPTITTFDMPVYGPWLEYEPTEVVLGNNEDSEAHPMNSIYLHEDGVGMCRRYSDKYFDLPKSTQVNVLGDQWTIDFWLSVLTAIPRTHTYPIEMLNLLFALHIELVRSYMCTLSSAERLAIDVYAPVKRYAHIIGKYMRSRGIAEMDNGESAPTDVRIAMDVITTGETHFYYGAQEFHRINLQEELTTSPAICEHIIKTVLDADVSDGPDFDIDGFEHMSGTIAKHIYNLLKSPHEIIRNLQISNTFGGRRIQLCHNKIGILCVIFKHIIGLNRQYDSPVDKIDRFCMLWKVVQKMGVGMHDICTEHVMDDLYEDAGVNQIYNAIENAQTNMIGLLQILGYDLLAHTMFKSNTSSPVPTVRSPTPTTSFEASLNLSQIKTLEQFVNTDLHNIRHLELIDRLNADSREWIDYMRDDNKPDVPAKFNFTPIRRFHDKGLPEDELPMSLVRNSGYHIIRKLLFPHDK